MTIGRQAKRKHLPRWQNNGSRRTNNSDGLSWRFARTRRPPQNAAGLLRDIWCQSPRAKTAKQEDLLLQKERRSKGEGRRAIPL